ASRNARPVLSEAGVLERFAVVVDGVDSDRLGLAGKPDPALFLAAAGALDRPPRATAVVEDAVAGVEAGRRGGFGLVVGVGRVGHAAELRAAGAGVVVSALDAVRVQHGEGDRGAMVSADPSSEGAVSARARDGAGGGGER